MPAMDCLAKVRTGIKREWPFHAMLLPTVVFLFLFAYLPMGGLIIAFQKFIPAKGLFGAQKWVGLQNFEYLFSLPNIGQILYNTVYIALWKMILGLIVPVIVAVLLNEVRSISLKRTVQTMVYMPYFLSWIVLSGVLIDILSPANGIVNMLLSSIGVEPVFFLGDNHTFRWTVIVTDIWKNFGFGMVTYLAAIANIDPNLYEAAVIDGANRYQRMLHVTLPGMITIIVLMSILSLGNVLNAGFDQVQNLLNPVVMETGDIIDTFVYRLGLVDAQYGISTAMGFFKSIVSTLFISVSYYLAYRLFDYRVF